MTARPEEWQSEAVRLHQRYSVEIVEHYGLCPWAERARLAGRTTVHALLPPLDATTTPSVEVLEKWGGDEGIEVAFLLYPRSRLSRVDFDAFVAQVQEQASGRHAIGQAPFALAAFHPDARPDMQTAERLVPFLRRTPDPCIQAVRMSVLQRVRSGTPQGTQFVDLDAILEFASRKEEVPLRERIARANLATVREASVEEVERRLADIRQDRERSYAALEARERA
jgi:hypothetical protein